MTDGRTKNETEKYTRYGEKKNKRTRRKEERQEKISREENNPGFRGNTDAHWILPFLFIFLSLLLSCCCPLSLRLFRCLFVIFSDRSGCLWFWLFFCIVLFSSALSGGYFSLVFVTSLFLFYFILRWICVLRYRGNGMGKTSLRLWPRVRETD